MSLFTWDFFNDQPAMIRKVDTAITENIFLKISQHQHRRKRLTFHGNYSHDIFECITNGKCNGNYVGKVTTR